MKITREQLQKLVQEEVEHLTYKLKKSTSEDVLSHDYPSEVKTQEDAFGGGANIVSDVDHLKAGGHPDKTQPGIERLKMSEGSNILSRAQIREAISEAIKQTLLVEAKITDVPEGQYPNIWKHIIVPLQAIVTGEEHMGQPNWEKGHKNEQIKFEIPDAVWPESSFDEIFTKDTTNYPNGLELTMSPPHELASKDVMSKFVGKYSEAADELKQLASAMIKTKDKKGNRQGSIEVGITTDVVRTTGTTGKGKTQDVSEGSLVNEAMGDLTESVLTRRQLRKIVNEAVANSISNWENRSTEEKIKALYLTTMHLADDMDRMHGEEHDKPVVTKGASSERLSSKDASLSDEEMMLKHGKKNENHT